MRVPLASFLVEGDLDDSVAELDGRLPELALTEFTEAEAEPLQLITEWCVGVQQGEFKDLPFVCTKGREEGECLVVDSTLKMLLATRAEPEVAAVGTNGEGTGLRILHDPCRRPTVSKTMPVTEGSRVGVEESEPRTADRLESVVAPTGFCGGIGGILYGYRRGVKTTKSQTRGREVATRERQFGLQGCHAYCRGRCLAASEWSIEHLGRCKKKSGPVGWAP